MAAKREGNKIKEFWYPKKKNNFIEVVVVVAVVAELAELVMRGLLFLSCKPKQPI